MSEHLWPARPEYLRRGTPAVVSEWRDVLVYCKPQVREGDLRVACIDDGEQRTEPEPLWPAIRAVSLDLRDPTARAHAAWAWTRVYVVAPELRADIWPEEKSVRTAACTLRRMAGGDPTVTVAEARAALEWAEGVSDE